MANTDILDRISFVEALPKAKRTRSQITSKYDVLVEYLMQPENTGKWIMLPDEYKNVQASTRLNKIYGEQGIKAASRRVEGSPDDDKRYNVFVAHNPVDEADENDDVDLDDEIDDEDEDEDEDA